MLEGNKSLKVKDSFRAACWERREASAITEAGGSFLLFFSGAISCSWTGHVWFVIRCITASDAIKIYAAGIGTIGLPWTRLTIHHLIDAFKNCRLLSSSYMFSEACRFLKTAVSWIMPFLHGGTAWIKFPMQAQSHQSRQLVECQAQLRIPTDQKKVVLDVTLPVVLGR
jgi:hypothetical protein